MSADKGTEFPRSEAANFYQHDDNDPCYDRKGQFIEHYYEQENNKLIKYLLIALGVVTFGFIYLV